MSKTKNRSRRRKLVAIQASNKIEGAFALTAAATFVQASGEGEAKKLPTVNVNAYNGGPMRVGGYSRPIVVDVAGVDGLGRPLPLLRGHNADRIVGHGVAAADGSKIAVEGVVSGTSEEAAEMVALAANGFPWQASIGLQPTKLQQVAEGSKVTVNGQQLSGPLTVVRAGKLYEVSIVPMGADDTTQASIAATKAARSEEEMDFAKWLTAKGFVEAELSDGQLKSMRAMYDAEQGAGSGAGSVTPPTGSANVTAAALINERRRREERSQAYANILAKYPNVPADMAELHLKIAEETQMEPDAFELALLRDGRSGAVSSAASSRTETSAIVIEAALAKATGAVDIEANYKPEVLEQVDRSYPRGLTLMEVVAMAARRTGFRSESYRISEGMLRAAFTPVQARGASTYDLSGVLSNVANKAIMAGFNSVESTWRQIAKISSVTDFKTVTRYALTGDFEYERVAKDGELKNATMGEQSYTNKANPYGKMFGISYEDLVNDDLGAFDQVRSRIGRGAALAMNKVFWTEFLADVTTFFTTGRANYFEGSSSNLQISSLTTAEQMFQDQTDPDGNPLGIVPAILLTPNSLGTTASSLANDTEIRDTTANKTYTTGNPHSGKFRPVRSSYLNNANIPNGSATHWFLLADPMDLAIIEMVFLNGRQEPTVEAANADFETLGVQMRGYHSFGASKQEYRAGVRSKGAA